MREHACVPWAECYAPESSCRRRLPRRRADHVSSHISYTIKSFAVCREGRGGLKKMHKMHKMHKMPPCTGGLRKAPPRPPEAPSSPQNTLGVHNLLYGTPNLVSDRSTSYEDHAVTRVRLSDPGATGDLNHLAQPRPGRRPGGNRMGTLRPTIYQSLLSTMQLTLR